MSLYLDEGVIYKSLAGCPVKLLEAWYANTPWNEAQSEAYVLVEYIDALNNDGYGKGATGWFRARDLSEWTDATP